jgi:hypothetical protein
MADEIRCPLQLVLVVVVHFRARLILLVGIGTREPDDTDFLKPVVVEEEMLPIQDGKIVLVCLVGQIVLDCLVRDGRLAMVRVLLPLRSFGSKKQY